MSKARKALMAAAGAAVATAQALAENGLTTGELGQVAGAAIVVGFLTWLVPNADPDRVVLDHVPGMPGDGPADGA